MARRRRDGCCVPHDDEGRGLQLPRHTAVKDCASAARLQTPRRQGIGGARSEHCGARHAATPRSWFCLAVSKFNALVTGPVMSWVHWGGGGGGGAVRGLHAGTHTHTHTHKSCAGGFSRTPLLPEMLRLVLLLGLLASCQRCLIATRQSSAVLIRWKR